MNRAQRKQMSKKLGILQFQQKLSRAKKFELMSQNIHYGKIKEQEMAEKTRVSIQKQEEEKQSSIISHNTEQISKNKNMPITDIFNNI